MATLFAGSFYTALDNNGDPVSGAKLNFYEVLTTTRTDTYTDTGRTIAHANPVVADADGRFPEIYLDDHAYKVVLTDADDIVIRTADPINDEFSSPDILNVKTEFGAVGNGAEDDRAAIQAAIDAAHAAGGGTVFFPPGTYLIDDRPSGDGFLQIYADNIWLKGAAKGAVTLKRAGSSELSTNDHLILIGEGASNVATNIKISDLTIDGNRAENTAGPEATHNIRIENATDIKLQDLEIKNGIYYGLHIRGEDATTKRITVRDCYIHTCGRDCLDLKNQGGFNDDIIIDGVVCENPGLLGTENDACFDFRGPVIASNLAAKLPGVRHHGIRLRGLDGSTVEGRPTITNFRIIAENTHAQDDLLLIEGIQAKISNGHLDNGGANGVQVQASRAMLSNIQVRNCGAAGFWLRDNTTAIGDRARLVNCLSAENTGAGFDIDTDNNTFVACEARSNTGIGFDIDAAADGNDFFDAQSSGNTAGDWVDLSTPETVTTSGTAFNFTIPPNAKKITVLFDRVSLSGTDELQITLGTAAAFEVTGYVGNIIQAGTGTTALSAEFLVVRAQVAAGAYSGIVTLHLMDSVTNKWLANGFTHIDTGATLFDLNGVKLLADILTRIQVGTNGSDTFDAGAIRVEVET